MKEKNKEAKDTNTNKEGKEKDSKYVQSLERALTIMEVMAEEKSPLAVSDIAAKVGLKISTVHRLLSTLCHRHYVEQDPDNKYRLGLKLLEVGNSSLYYSDVRKVARPFMEELVEVCNESVNLAVLDDNHVVYIDNVESKNIIMVKMFAQVGNRGSVHCTGTGKALMAFLPEKRIDEILVNTEFEKHTNETITNIKDFKKELERVRNEGYALDWGEREEHVRCIAAPIFNHEGDVVASISVSGPSNRITTVYMKNELAGLVKEYATKISRRMGYTKGL